MYSTQSITIFCHRNKTGGVATGAPTKHSTPKELYSSCNLTSAVTEFWPSAPPFVKQKPRAFFLFSAVFENDALLSAFGCRTHTDQRGGAIPNAKHLSRGYDNRGRTPVARFASQRRHCISAVQRGNDYSQRPPPVQENLHPGTYATCRVPAPRRRWCMNAQQRREDLPGADRLSMERDTSARMPAVRSPCHGANNISTCDGGGTGIPGIDRISKGLGAGAVARIPPASFPPHNDDSVSIQCGWEAATHCADHPSGGIDDRVWTLHSSFPCHGAYGVSVDGGQGRTSSKPEACARHSFPFPNSVNDSRVMAEPSHASKRTPVASLHECFHWL